MNELMFNFGKALFTTSWIILILAFIIPWEWLKKRGTNAIEVIRELGGVSFTLFLVGMVAIIISVLKE